MTWVNDGVGMMSWIDDGEKADIEDERDKLRSDLDAAGKRIEQLSLQLVASQDLRKDQANALRAEVEYRGKLKVCLDALLEAPWTGR